LPITVPDKIFRDNKRRAVVFKAIYCLYKTGRCLLIDVTSRDAVLYGISIYFINITNVDYTTIVMLIWMQTD